MLEDPRGSDESIVTETGLPKLSKRLDFRPEALPPTIPSDSGRAGADLLPLIS